MSARIKVSKKGKTFKKRKKPRIAADMDSLVLLSKKKWIQQLSNCAKMSSVDKFTGRQDAEDKEVYNKCNKEDFHVLTGNYRHFKNFPKTKKDVGVIGHSNPLTENVYKKLKVLIESNDNEYFKGKYINVSDSNIKEYKRF